MPKEKGYAWGGTAGLIKRSEMKRTTPGPIKPIDLMAVPGFRHTVEINRKADKNKRIGK